MDLEEFWLFNTLDKQEIQQLKSISIKKSYNKDEILFYEKDESKYLHLLINGSVKIYKYDFKGNEIVLHNLKSPNLIAEIVNFDEIPYPANCTFEEDGEIYLIDYEKFKENFLCKSKISTLFIKSLILKIKALENFINYSITSDSYTNTARFINEHEDILSTVKQIKIASLLNITPETLSRNISKLKKENIIEKENGHIKIIDYDKLKNIIS